MKHYTQGGKRRVKKVHAQPKTEELSAGKPAQRPTAERMARGVWTEPTGMGKNEIPVTDVASDMIGLLLFERKITDTQEQAARTFQSARWDYLHELPEIGEYKSCLNAEQGGYDDSDGNEAAIQRYREIERAVGKAGVSQLIWVCQGDGKPYSLEGLRVALDAISNLSYS